MQTRKCDKCKKKLNEHSSTEGISTSIHGAMTQYFISFDLCNGCSKKFLPSLKKFANLKVEIKEN